MMVCGQDSKTLAAYLDGELAADQAGVFEQHLRNCTECASEIASLARLRRGLKVARDRFSPSDDFRRKIQGQIRGRRRSWGTYILMPAALVAVCVLAVALVWTQRASNADSFREVADLHVGDLASANPYDVVSSDPHTVKPWFQGRIPFSFNVPEFASTEFTLLGGRLIYLHQQPGAQLVVAMRQHRISVLILQDSAELTRAIPVTPGVHLQDSFNVETWQTHGLRFFVVGDADSAVIDKLSQLVRSVNE